MFKTAVAIRVALVCIYFTVAAQSEAADRSAAVAVPSCDSAQISPERAWREQKSNVQVSGIGRVIKLLDDDEHGSRHQRFIVRLASGHTVLIVHNIDLATRINNLHLGAEVAFCGEYEWNNKGGLVHWTHHDPERRRAGGWLSHQGRTYR